MGKKKQHDYLVERDGVKYAGNHLLIDLYGAQKLDDLSHMEQAFKECIRICGATLLHIHLHHFTPNGGISGVAVLAESHMSVHTWPERNFAAFDVFMCGAAKPELAVDPLRQFFHAQKVWVTDFKRGDQLFS